MKWMTQDSERCGRCADSHDEAEYERQKSVNEGVYSKKMREIRTQQHLKTRKPVVVV